MVGLWWSIQPAFIEECFFRGLFKTFFSFFKFEKAQKAVYVLASGMLFGLGHIPQGVIAVLSTTLVGVFFAYQHLKIKHILPFVIAHCIGNLISLFFF